MNIKEINEEVFYTSEAVTKITSKDIEFMKEKASGNRRRKVRLCSHKDTEDSLHEMLIIHAKGAYVRPHKHRNKSESFHIIEGKLDVVIFNETGDILEVIHMGDYRSRDIFYYRLSESRFHTVIPLSDFVIFHEVTNGPFRSEDCIFASWAPAEDETDRQGPYLKELSGRPTKEI